MKSTITRDAPSADTQPASNAKTSHSRSSRSKGQTSGTSADRIAGNEASGIGKGTTLKPKAEEPKVPRFEDRITEAMRYARHELHAHRPGLKEGQRPAASSGGDHVAVRAKVEELVGEPVTADKVLKLTGLTLPKIERVARFDPDSTEDMKALRILGSEFKEDKNAAWRQGRYLAGIVAAYVVELRAAEKAAKAK